MFKTPLPEQMSPTWKMMLLSDGSVTRHLQLLTGQHIEVVSCCLAPPSMQRSAISSCQMPSALASLLVKAFIFHKCHPETLLPTQDCLEMQGIGEDLSGLPEGVDQILGPRVQRQVIPLSAPLSDDQLWPSLAINQLFRLWSS